MRFGGYARGGGYGFTSVIFGMNCDDAVAFRVMLADRFIGTADATTNPDLYWALCGGTGGNFGVVPSVTYRLHDIGQVTRYAVEAAATGAAAGDLALPETLAESLIARLDRLADGRQFAQIGAVIGNEFPEAILGAVPGLPEAEWRRGIDALLQAGVLRKGHSNFGPAVDFQHRLPQDAACLALLRRDRTVLHAKTARALRDSLPELAEAAPQVIAYHVSLGGDPAEAGLWWDRAGQIAARRSAYSEAIGHFRRALEDVEGAPVHALAVDRAGLGARRNLVAALIAFKGFAAPELREEARAELEAVFALYDSGRHDTCLGRVSTSHQAAMAAVGLAEMAALDCDLAGVARWTAKAERISLQGGGAKTSATRRFSPAASCPRCRAGATTWRGGAADLRAHATAHDLPLRVGYADRFTGITLMHSGRVPKGRLQADRGIARSLGSAGFLRLCMLLHAEA